MILKLFISAVPATILGWMMWDLITLFEKINQLQRENHIHEEELQRLQDDIKDNRREIVEVLSVCKLKPYVYSPT